MEKVLVTVSSTCRLSLQDAGDRPADMDNMESLMWPREREDSGRRSSRTVDPPARILPFRGQGMLPPNDATSEKGPVSTVCHQIFWLCSC